MSSSMSLPMPAYTSIEKQTCWSKWSSIVLSTLYVSILITLGTLSIVLKPVECTVDLDCSYAATCNTRTNKCNCILYQRSWECNPNNPAGTGANYWLYAFLFFLFLSPVFFIAIVIKDHQIGRINRLESNMQEVARVLDSKLGVNILKKN
jgi:hypothetical protein